jgi:enamine deaminase RidA (YjgF/YER057c/UK114 family)
MAASGRMRGQTRENTMMNKRHLNASDAADLATGYSQVVEVSNATRTAFVSGQIPMARDGMVPETFREQCLLVWRNIDAQLRAADMSLDNLVKVTIFLSDRKYNAENRAIRREILGDRAPALTVIITGIFDEAWLLEIEAIAMA